MQSICLRQYDIARKINVTLSPEEMRHFGRMKVYFWHDFSACGYYRCYMPSQYLQKNGLAQTISSYDDQMKIEADETISPYVRESSRIEEMKNEIVDQRIAWADVVVMQRMGGAGTHALIEKIKKSGKMFVHECDDLCEEVPEGNPAHWYWRDRTIKDNHAHGFRSADLVTATNPRLASFYQKEYGRPAEVLPSQLDLGVKRWDIDYVKSMNEVVIGWMGSESHSVDALILEPVIKKILEMHPNVRFEFLGWAPDWQMGLERTILKECNLVDVPKFMSSWDIGLAPLTDHRFNTVGKCDIKLLEYGGAYIAPVMADLEPYASSVQDGSTGILAKWDDPEDWIRKIDKLVRRPTLRLEIAKRLHDWVWNTRVYSFNCVKWFRAYSSLINGGGKSSGTLAAKA